MKPLRPFWCYYGGKYRLAPRYPAPRYNTIIEPFAGAAGYSTRHPEGNVHLYDADPIIAGLWAYLIGVSASEIMALPTVVETVDDITGPQEARWLVGFWLNKGMNMPAKRPSAWYRSGIRGGSFWGPEIRERIASQVDRIRHWTITVRTPSHLTPNPRRGSWIPRTQTRPGGTTDLTPSTIRDWANGAVG